MGKGVKRLLLATSVLGLLAAGASLAGWQWLERYAHAPMAHTEDYRLDVPSGATLVSVLRQLAADALVEHPDALRLHAKLSDYGHRIQAGRYTVPVGMTPVELVAQLRDGAVDLAQVQLIEGWTIAQAIEALLANEAINDDLDITLERRADGVAFLSSADHARLADLLGVEGDHVEGQIYPDTYRFAPGTRASELLTLAHDKLQEELMQAWSERAERETLPDPESLLILASIVEKETRRDDERAEIAGVFDRRLQRGMRLQTDPTVIYGAGKRYDGDIRRRDLNDENAYNTYRIAGLPPTPIALAGRASLRATAQPADGQTLFFVASGDPDGSHVFSETAEAHEAAVQRYLKKLRARP